MLPCNEMLYAKSLNNQCCLQLLESIIVLHMLLRRAKFADRPNIIDFELGGNNIEEFRTLFCLAPFKRSPSIIKTESSDSLITNMLFTLPDSDVSLIVI